MYIIQAAENTPNISSISPSVVDKEVYKHALASIDSL